MFVLKHKSFGWGISVEEAPLPPHSNLPHPEFQLVACRHRVAALPFYYRLTRRGGHDFDRARLCKRLHVVLQIFLVLGFRDQDEGVLAVQHRIPDQIHAESPCVRLGEML